MLAQLYVNLEIVGIIVFNEQSYAVAIISAERI